MPFVLIQEILQKILLKPFPLHLPFPSPSWMSLWAGIGLILSILLMLDRLFPRLDLSNRLPFIPSRFWPQGLLCILLAVLPLATMYAYSEPAIDLFVGLIWAALYLVTMVLLIKATTRPARTELSQQQSSQETGNLSRRERQS